MSVVKTQGSGRGRRHLTPTQRRELASELWDARDKDRHSMLRFEYVIDRGLESYGQGEDYTPGYDELHGVSFKKVLLDLQDRFPEQKLKGLDVGCGKGVAASEMVDFSKTEPAMQPMDFHGTNLIKRQTLLEPGRSHVMPGHRLDFEDDTFHLVVSTEAATRHNSRWDVVVEEMYRVAAPGGIVMFHGISHSDRVDGKSFFEKFEKEHGVKVRKSGVEGYVIEKPAFR